MSGRPDLGAWLREQRERNLWTQQEMARRLIKAAASMGDTAMPTLATVAHNVYRWERGMVEPGERYRMYYCVALGIAPAELGVRLAPVPAPVRAAPVPAEARVVVITITLPEGTGAAVSSPGFPVPRCQADDGCDLEEIPASHVTLQAATVRLT